MPQKHRYNVHVTKNQHSQSEKNLIRLGNLFKSLDCQQSSKSAVVTVLILGQPALPPVFKTTPLTCYSHGLWGPRLEVASGRGWKRLISGESGEVPKLRTFFVSVDAWMSSAMIIIWYGWDIKRVNGLYLIQKCRIHLPFFWIVFLSKRNSRHKKTTTLRSTFGQARRGFAGYLVFACYPHRVAAEGVEFLKIRKNRGNACAGLFRMFPTQKWASKSNMELMQSRRRDFVKVKG